VLYRARSVGWQVGSRDVDTGKRSREVVEVFCKVGMADVTQLEAITAKFRILDRQYGGLGILDAVQAQYRQGNHLMKAASNDNVRRRMAAALADHGNLAGWVANDVGLGDAARAHLYRAMDFASFSGDRAVAAATLRHTGRIEAHRGDPDYALKFSSSVRWGNHRRPHASLSRLIRPSCMPNLVNTDAPLRHYERVKALQQTCVG